MSDLFVQDGSEVEVVAPNIEMRRGPDDCADPTNGPNGQGCSQNAVCVDETKFDESFICDCLGLASFSGPNCLAVPAPAGATDNSGTAAGVTVVVLVLIGGGLVAAYIVHEKRKAAKVPHDFEAQLQKMLNDGLIKVVKDADGTEKAARIPQELPRNDICPLDVLGAGEFGEVYKALYLLPSTQRENKTGNYVTDEHRELVAVKTLKGVSGEVSREERDILMAEATVTAQFEHPNIVRLLGVVTVGTPLMIVLELCAHGELKKMVAKYVTMPTKIWIRSLSLITEMKFFSQI